MARLSKQFNPTPEALEKSQRQGTDLSRGTHGTTMKSESPEYILPAKKANVGTHYELSNPDKAYYNAQAGEGWHGDPQGATATYSWGTHDPKEYASRQGWKWAQEAVGHGIVTMQETGRTTKAGTPELKESPRARAVVHHVEPVGTVEPDVNLPWTSAMTADKLKVTDTEWIPPSRFERAKPTAGMQGTLPNVNWNQFSDHPRHLEQNWHEYGVPPGETGSQRVLRRMVADGRLPADSPHNPDLDQVRNAKANSLKQVEGQMEMFDRPATWDSPGKKADI